MINIIFNRLCFKMHTINECQVFFVALFVGFGESVGFQEATALANDQIVAGLR